MRQTRYVISGYGKLCRNLLVFFGFLAILLPIRKDENYEKRNRFVAAKIDDNVTLYAMCSQKKYERTIVNKSIGLFFTLGDDTIRVIVL